MKTISLNLLVFSMCFLYYTVSGQEYFTSTLQERCIDRDFKQTLIKAFNQANDTIRYFRSEDIVEANFETKCVGFIEDSIQSPPDFPVGRLDIFYRNKKTAARAFENLLMHTKLPAHSSFYGIVKSGLMYVCLKKNRIEIYKTNEYNQDILNPKKLEEYLLSNKKKYDRIVWLSHRQGVIK